MSKERERTKLLRRPPAMPFLVDRGMYGLHKYVVGVLRAMDSDLARLEHRMDVLEKSLLRKDE